MTLAFPRATATFRSGKPLIRFTLFLRDPTRPSRVSIEVIVTTLTDLKATYVVAAAFAGMIVAGTISSCVVTSRWALRCA